MQCHLRRAGLINDRGGHAAPQADEKMNSSVTVPAVYVGTYHQYNGGSIFGKWFDLTDFDDEDEFYDACRALHAAEDDPEFMFQDWEGIPSQFASESSVKWAFIEAFRQAKDAPPRLWPGRNIPASATMTPLTMRIVARLKARRILLMALWRITAC